MKKLVLAAVMALLTLALPLGAQIARADANSVDFESPTYTTGSPDGQDGWTLTHPSPDDVAIDSSLGTAGFGAQSLRISNAVTSGPLGHPGVFSKPLADEAGESGADNGGLSGGTRRNHFVSKFDIASAVPGAGQPGLDISVSPDRGDGSRMSFLRFEDTPGGIDVDFSDYEDQAPFGSLGTPADGCGAGDGFVTTTVASGLDRSVPHKVKLRMWFPDGPGNDIVEVWIDGVRVHTGTSWEDYYRYCEGALTSRTVDSLLFQIRPSGGGDADNLGHGFLIDNVNLTSSTVTPEADLSVSQADSPDPVNSGNDVVYHVAVTNDGPDPAGGVMLHDSPPGTFISGTQDNGGPPCFEGEGGVYCDVGAISSGETRTVDIVVQSPDTSESTSITNDADIFQSATDDPNPGNNTSSEDTQVDPAGQGSGGNQGSTGYVPPTGGTLTTDTGAGATPDDPTTITLKLGDGPGGTGSIEELDQCMSDPDLSPCVGDIGNFNPPPGYDKVTVILVYDRSQVAGGLAGHRKHWHILYQKDGVTQELSKCGPNPVANNLIPCWKQVIRLPNHDLRVRAYINSDPKLATRK